ncbi:uncharacterized protein LOC129593734 [Paramacrobiotus metropolitanus]|uniref:uncharacterized protein LOC129593734 n=1 Tax=Paramacrobiotus metropolitanus TaxID=2943436 RepID=UPI002445DEE8|nr:uncharacterized protein LOC129593734 [Paramacrobiotus metropolitanus]
MDSKAIHEKFVQTSTGSSNAYVCFTLASISFYFLIREIALLSIPRSHHKWLPFLYDFLLITIPMIHSITYVTEGLVIKCFMLLLCASPSLWIYHSSKKTQHSGKHPEDVPHLSHGRSSAESPRALGGVAVLERYVVTSYRGIIMLFTTLCILAVDFPVFPRKMAKTVESGYSVMDLGVGAFVIANGLVAPQAKEKGRSSLRMVISELKDSFLLIILGFGRFVSITMTNYQSPEEEYGKHWNFFCTLAVVKIFSRLAAVFIRAEFLPLAGIGLAVIYEIILQNGLYDYLLIPSSDIHSSMPVSRLLVDNRSGIASSVGFLALFLIWTHFARCFRVERKSRLQHVRLVGDLACWCLIGFLICRYLPLPSRRFANASYIFWTSYLALGFLTTLVVSRMIVVWLAGKKTIGGISILEWLSHLPLAIPALNYNALTVFLVANVLTGAVNLSMDTVHTSDFLALCILCFYSILVCFVACALYSAKWRARFRFGDIGQFLTDAVFFPVKSKKM